MSLVIPDNLSVWIGTFPKAAELKSDPPTLYSLCVLPSHCPVPFSWNWITTPFLSHSEYCVYLLLCFFCDRWGLKFLILWQLFQRLLYTMFSFSNYIAGVSGKIRSFKKS